MKAKRRYKPVDVERFHGWVAEQPCLACDCWPPSTVHHVRGYADKPGSITKNDWLVAPLCPRHHLYQHGPRESVEALGHQGFFLAHGVDLYAEAMRLAEAYQRKVAA